MHISNLSSFSDFDKRTNSLADKGVPTQIPNLNCLNPRVTHRQFEGTVYQE